MEFKMKPAQPGSILREDILKETGISITKAAEGMRVSRKQLSKVVNESASISPEMALRLEHGFGVEAQFWLALQTKYDLWKLKSQRENPEIHRITN